MSDRTGSRRVAYRGEAEGTDVHPGQLRGLRRATRVSAPARLTWTAAPAPAPPPVPTRRPRPGTPTATASRTLATTARRSRTRRRPTATATASATPATCCRPATRRWWRARPPRSRRSAARSSSSCRRARRPASRPEGAGRRLRADQGRGHGPGRLRDRRPQGRAGDQDGVEVHVQGPADGAAAGPLRRRRCSRCARSAQTRQKRAANGQARPPTWCSQTPPGLTRACASASDGRSRSRASCAR